MMAPSTSCTGVCGHERANASQQIIVPSRGEVGAAVIVVVGAAARTELSLGDTDSLLGRRREVVRVECARVVSHHRSSQHAHHQQGSQKHHAGGHGGQAATRQSKRLNGREKGDAHGAVEKGRGEERSGQSAEEPLRSTAEDREGEERDEAPRKPTTAATQSTQQTSREALGFSTQRGQQPIRKRRARKMPENHWRSFCCFSRALSRSPTAHTIVATRDISRWSTSRPGLCARCNVGAEVERALELLGSFRDWRPVAAESSSHDARSRERGLLHGARERNRLDSTHVLPIASVSAHLLIGTALSLLWQTID